MKGPSQMLIQTSLFSQGVDNLQSHEVRVPKILFLEGHRFQSLFQFIDGHIQIIQRLMFRSQGTKKVEIYPVGTLVRLGILIDGYLSSRNNSCRRFRQIPHLIVPFVRSYIDY